MALSHSRDACQAPTGKCVLFFDSAKQETELEQLRKEERLVKVACPCSVICLMLLVSLRFFAFVILHWIHGVVCVGGLSWCSLC